MSLESLEALLDEMSDAIKMAKFAKLESLISQVESASDILQIGVTKADLQRLQNKARRNATAALAAGRGVRAALQRIKDIQENAFSLRTYDRRGKRAEVIEKGEISRRL